MGSRAQGTERGLAGCIVPCIKVATSGYLTWIDDNHTKL